MYLTYNEYKGLGGTLEATAFNRNITRVTGIIKNATHGRLDKMSTIPSTVKALCMDLIEYLHNNPANSKLLSGKSQSANGVSESESYTVKTKEEQEIEIDTMICDYLLSEKDDNGTPLLYRGCAV